MLISSIVHVILIVICFDSRVVTCEKNYENGSAYVDNIINTYNNLEEKLWFLIGSSNQSDLMLKVHKEHLDFFRNSFSIERRRSENYKNNFETLFGWEVLSLSSEIDFVKNFQLHDSFDELSADETVQMARSYIGYTKTLTTIYNRTVRTNLFEQIYQVSMF